MTSNYHSKRVLLIEDNIGDVKLIEEAISANQLNLQLEVLDDGEKAKRFFNDCRENDYVNVPDLIICDLNLPRVKGDEVIKLFKSDPVFGVVPILVLTTSNLDLDINKCYQLGANSYLIKPLDVLEFFEMIKHVYTFWLQLSELPSGQNKNMG